VRLVACLSFLLFLAGCGYVGPVLPPSPEIPSTITDLSVVERGDKILITFTAPPRTTDGVAITHFAAIDLRVNTAKIYAVDLPPPSDRDDPQPKPIAYSIPVADFTGQRISVSVQTAMKKTGHFSAWSNTGVLDVVQPLGQPVVHAEGSATGIVLNWPASDDAQYRIQRQGVADKLPVDLATVNENHYVDVSAQYDTDYRYTVTAQKGSAESLASEPLTFSAKDIYPPAVPTGLTVLAGPDGIDLAWQRNAEPDLQGYYIYRSADNGPYIRQGGLINLPTFIDHITEHGKTYSYKISAADKRANESAQSSPAVAQY
jgi:hypothetical protein